jgi:hypothetical protein
MRRFVFALTVTIGLLLASCITVVIADEPGEPAVTANAPFSAADIEYFEKKVRPLLVSRCYSCHAAAAKTVQGGLRLDSLAAIRIGGDSGPVVVPGKPAESLFIAAILYGKDSEVQMPPKGRLPDEEIAELTRWVERGAPFPPSTDPAVEHDKKVPIDFTAAREFWSFRQAVIQPLPETKPTLEAGGLDWPNQRLDHFVLASMQAKGLSPSPPASRGTLLRRLSFDLTGLPPTAAEVERFVNDTSPNAYEKQVNRLLESPQFGERWAREWLDLARYTDKTASWLYSTGEAHLYRDWVVQAMNADLPYDQFVRRQLATDLMPETAASDIPALGFLGISPNYWKELQLPTEIIKVIVADEWEERVDAVSRTFLGLTVACARCHDHKFDPITTEDYYAMAGVFASSRLIERPIIDEHLFAPVKAARAEVATLEKQIADLKKQKPKPTDEADAAEIKAAEIRAAEIKAAEAKIADLKTSTPHYNVSTVPAVAEEALYVERAGKTPQDGSKLVYQPEPRDLNVFIRGNPNRLGEPVPRRFLQVLSKSDAKRFEQGSGRLELASALTVDAQSLTARVIVNRIWLAHFGRGIVNTPSNFGHSGELPSHPELLDDLAARFIDNGWSLKRLHREIVLSATYRQISHSKPAQQTAGDPENVWLSRMNRRRLTVEAWRDAMLLAAGQLETHLGGKSQDLTVEDNNRRTLYGTVHRRDMSTMLLMHDFPDPTAHSPQRIATTTTLQGLYALNGPLLLRASATFSERLHQHADDMPTRIRRCYALLYQREPTDRELKIGTSFLSAKNGEQTAEAAWVQYAHVLLASNEFLFID